MQVECVVQMRMEMCEGVEERTEYEGVLKSMEGTPDGCTKIPWESEEL